MNIVLWKRCCTCGEWKHKVEFHKETYRKDGLNPSCKVCRSAILRKSKIKHADDVREYNSKWRSENHDKTRANSLRWIANNLEKYRDQRRRRKHARRARISGNGGKYTATEWQALKEFYNYTCLCCGQKEPNVQITPDHVIPISIGGSNSIDNIQPLCLSCNRKKHIRHIDYRGGQYG